MKTIREVLLDADPLRHEDDVFMMNQMEACRRVAESGLRMPPLSETAFSSRSLAPWAVAAPVVILGVLSIAYVTTQSSRDVPPPADSPGNSLAPPPRRELSQQEDTGDPWAEGKSLVERACTTCHDSHAVYVGVLAGRQQKRYVTQEDYEELVSRENARGAGVSAAESAPMVDWLMNFQGFK